MESRILDRYSPMLGSYDQFDLGDIEPEMVWLTEKASAMAKQYWGDAFQFEHDGYAIKFTENTLKPLIQYTAGDSDRPDLEQIDEQFEEAIEEYGELDNIPDPDYHITTFDIVRKEQYENRHTDPRHINLNNALNHLDTDEIDAVVGVYSGGMNSTYIASDYFDDPDEILVRYSHLKRWDTYVRTTPDMDERIDDIIGKNILVVDDVLDSGETMKAVSTYLHQFSPDSVKGFAHKGGGSTGLVSLDYDGIIQRVSQWFGGSPGITPFSRSDLAPTRG